LEASNTQAEVRCEEVKEAVRQCRLAVPYCRHSAGTSHVKGSIRKNVGAVPFFSGKKHNTASLSVRHCRQPPVITKFSSVQTTIHHGSEFIKLIICSVFSDLTALQSLHP